MAAPRMRRWGPIRLWRQCLRREKEKLVTPPIRRRRRRRLQRSLTPSASSLPRAAPLPLPAPPLSCRPRPSPPLPHTPMSSHHWESTRGEPLERVSHLRPMMWRKPQRQQTTTATTAEVNPPPLQHLLWWRQNNSSRSPLRSPTNCTAHGFGTIAAPRRPRPRRGPSTRSLLLLGGATKVGVEKTPLS